MRRVVLALAGILAALVVVPAEAAPPGPERFSDFTYERVRVPMRDGVQLSVDIWRPVVPAGRTVPVILSLTPYHVLYATLDPFEEDIPVDEGGRQVLNGYAYARADVRGTYASGGCWNYGGIEERHDGYDLVEWLGTRGWSNGKVGMIGASYDGTTANAAAVERPPHLATIVPISAISRWYGYAYQQGARATISGEDDDIDPPGVTPPDFMYGYGFLPPPDPGALTAPQQTAMRWTPCDRLQQTTKAYSTQPDYDAFWVERDYLRLASRVNVPVLVTHGFQDYNVKTWEGTAWFQALRVPKILVAGQWPHASPRTRYPDWAELIDMWWARWLYGVRNGVETGAPVRVQGTDREWRDARSWGSPLRAQALGTGDPSFLDDGTLTESEMLRGPANPRFVTLDVPGTGERRISGRPRLRLTATSDQPGTHLVAVLVQVAPNGARTVISRAFLNARYRTSLTKGVDLTPGRAYQATLEFIDKEHLVPEGHRIQVLVASSSTTWVAPDEHRARTTIHLAGTRLDLPLR